MNATATTGFPRMVATEPLPVDRQGQRHQLLVWPCPDTDYTLTAQMILLPERLSPTNPFAYGGQDHAETIKASCLAAAELEDDGIQGPLNAHWQERLAASIAADSKLRPTLVGYNADHSLHRYKLLRRNTITVNGEER